MKRYLVLVLIILVLNTVYAERVYDLDCGKIKYNKIISVSLPHSLVSVIDPLR